MHSSTEFSAIDFDLRSAGGSGSLAAHATHTRGCGSAGCGSAFAGLTAATGAVLLRVANQR